MDYAKSLRPAPDLRSGGHPRWVQAPIGNEIAGATLLAQDLLLAIADIPVNARTAELTLRNGDTTAAVPVRGLRYADRSGGEDRTRALLMLFLPPDWAGAAERLEVLPGGNPSWPAAPIDLRDSVTDFRTFVRDHLAGLTATVRADLLEFVLEAVTVGDAQSNQRELHGNLHALREALRQRLPDVIIAPDQPHGIGIDGLLAIDERTFFMSGWLRDPHGTVTSLTAVSPEGSRVDLLACAPFRYHRPDISQLYGDDPAVQDNPAGNMVHFEAPFPSLLAGGWVVELRDNTGSATELAMPAALRDREVVRARLIGELANERLPNDQLRQMHIFPALSRLQERHQEESAVDRVVQFGPPVEQAQVSIIVPLYQRIDFLEHQLVQFADDPAMERVDLIYVLDSPELTDALLWSAERLARLYRRSFRVAVMRRNSGFSAANNAGAALARGRLLLLLNSDVLPDRPGWLEKMAAFYDATPGIGALGAKLIFEDNSIQHAGLYFRWLDGLQLWENRHYFKGLNRNLPEANVARPMPAVTAACLMIDTRRYLDLGGLRGIYVQGDFEDSDLCLRLIEASYQNWYLPEVELYHLEGQSYPAPLRQTMFQYNAWLHTFLWGTRIDELMAAQTAAVAGTAPRSRAA